jgi:hypothetical protein
VRWVGCALELEGAVLWAIFGWEGWLVDWAGLEEEGGSVCRGGDDGEGYLDNVV